MLGYRQQRDKLPGLRFHAAHKPADVRTRRVIATEWRLHSLFRLQSRHWRHTCPNFRINIFFIHGLASRRRADRLDLGLQCRLSLITDGDIGQGRRLLKVVKSFHSIHNDCIQLILVKWLWIIGLSLDNRSTIQTGYNFGFGICMFLPRCMEWRRGLAMRFLSVRPSVKRVDCDKTKEKSVQIFIPCERSFTLVLWEKDWLLGGDPFYPKFWVNRPPLERNRQFWIWTNNRS